jgi:predicted XRE-type DNA-binding protein
LPPGNYQHRVGQALILALAEDGLTQAQIVKQVGLKQQRVSAILNEYHSS